MSGQTFSPEDIRNGFRYTTPDGYFPKKRIEHQVTYVDDAREHCTVRTGSGNAATWQRLPVAWIVKSLGTGYAKPVKGA